MHRVPGVRMSELVPNRRGLETALAADSMSSTIAAIRSDTESVATEIDEVERKLGEVDEQMDQFKKAIGEFVTSIAA